MKVVRAIAGKNVDIYNIQSHSGLTPSTANPIQNAKASNDAERILLNQSRLWLY